MASGASGEPHGRRMARDLSLRVCLESALILARIFLFTPSKMAQRCKQRLPTRSMSCGLDGTPIHARRRLPPSRLPAPTRVSARAANRDCDCDDPRVLLPRTGGAGFVPVLCADGEGLHHL